jgi:hypothetical protein
VIDSAPEPQCLSHDPDRQVFYGDLHVHTSFSWDAYGWGTRTDPDGAYAYARGGLANLATPAGELPRLSRLARPLDFAAVTDHSEFLGAAAHGDCTPRLSAWRFERAAAERAYDRSPACRFTSLVGYEWTGNVGERWWHRSVIFGNSQVPGLPASALDRNTPEELWASLEKSCLGQRGCDVITIPHNPNWSGGLMFNMRDDTPQRAAMTRARMEPLVEIFQHKGGSECARGAGTDDPRCNFYDRFHLRCAEHPDGMHCRGGNFVRNALRRGLQLERGIGVNPFKLGIIAGTDTHNGTPGATDEATYQGHLGLDDANPRRRLRLDLGSNSAGGLAAVWAEENSRTAIFAALKRRETFGTSGTRLRVRFFGGWDLPQDMCRSSSFAHSGYAQGVPMGGDLAARAGGIPGFAVWALQDPGTSGSPGTPLQQIQIIKGWVDAAGVSHERVITVAGAEAKAAVETASCTPPAEGSSSLCAVWTDPDFRSQEAAFYYARVLEEPTCSVYQRACNQIAADARPRTCTDGSLDMTVEHRAWTSPIWYHP